MLDKNPKGKFKSREKPCIFVGYSNENKAYRVWVTEERKNEVTRDIKFLEQDLVSQDECPGADSQEYILMKFPDAVAGGHPDHLNQRNHLNRHHPLKI